MGTSWGDDLYDEMTYDFSQLDIIWVSETVFFKCLPQRLGVAQTLKKQSQHDFPIVPCDIPWFQRFQHFNTGCVFHPSRVPAVLAQPFQRQLPSGLDNWHMFRQNFHTCPEVPNYA